MPKLYLPIERLPQKDGWIQIYDQYGDMVFFPVSDDRSELEDTAAMAYEGVGKPKPRKQPLSVSKRADIKAMLKDQQIYLEHKRNSVNKRLF
jgi:hypothetical protein